MLTAFRLHNLRLEQIQSQEPDELSEDAVWVDVVDPSNEDRVAIKKVFDVGPIRNGPLGHRQRRADLLLGIRSPEI